MKTNYIGRSTTLALALAAAAVCAQAGEQVANPTAESDAVTHLYLDVHEMGPGNVTAEAVAEAHEADLRVQSKFGVNFLRYWVDEKNGKVYCVSEAPNPNAVIATHREAHGLIPASVAEVTGGQ